MTTKNIIFFTFRKTGPKIYVVVNIIWLGPDFSLEIRGILVSDFSVVGVTMGKEKA